MRGATDSIIKNRGHTQYFNPRTPCGVRPGSSRCKRRDRDFNPRTPCGVRLSWLYFRAIKTGFQSTHPMRGATDEQRIYQKVVEYFNPRTPCGCDVGATVTQEAIIEISIHAPHAGCDSEQQSRKRLSLRFQSTHPMRGATCKMRLTKLSKLEFQSTHPMRGATAHLGEQEVLNKISIHAPHAGCDIAEHGEEY